MTALDPRHKDDVSPLVPRGVSLREPPEQEQPGDCPQLRDGVTPPMPRGVSLGEPPEQEQPGER